MEWTEIVVVMQNAKKIVVELVWGYYCPLKVNEVDSAWGSGSDEDRIDCVLNMILWSKNEQLGAKLHTVVTQLATGTTFYFPGSRSWRGLGLWCTCSNGMDCQYERQDFSAIATDFIPTCFPCEILEWWNLLVVDAVNDAVENLRRHNKAGTKVEKGSIPIACLCSLFMPVF